MKTIGQLELVLPNVDAELFCDWVREVWGTEPVAFEKPGGAQTVVKIFFATPAKARTHRRKIPARFAKSAAQAMPCHEKDWTTFWRHHFKIQDVGQRLRTVPIWEKVPDQKRLNIRIEPGLSFGTGDHFTTRFCLEEVERACVEIKPRSMLDAGTGSGILAIAAAKLGVPKVAGFDFDPVCVTQSRENAVLNRLPKGRIRFYQADILQTGWCRQPADLVCANILTSVLLTAAADLWQATKKRLILTGIREFEGDSVADAFMRLGAREIRRDGDGEWCGIVLARPIL